MENNISSYTNMDNNQNVNYLDKAIPLGSGETLNKRVYFHQYIAFQISKNPHLLSFAKQNLATTHPRSILKVEFGDDGEMILTYDQDEEPVKYTTLLTRDLTITDISWSTKYSCYYDYLKGAPFVVDADIIALLYLASLEGDTATEIIGEWMKSATKGRYQGFNPVHLSR